MEYEVTVYRTMVQKVTIVKDSPIPLSNEVAIILKEEAEDEAAEMYDYEWTDVSSDIKYTWTSIELRR